MADQVQRGNETNQVGLFLLLFSPHIFSNFAPKYVWKRDQGTFRAVWYYVLVIDIVRAFHKTDSRRSLANWREKWGQYKQSPWELVSLISPTTNRALAHF